MKMFEYKEVGTKVVNEEVLNEYGKLGWELCFLTDSRGKYDDGSGGITLYLKREVLPST